MMDRQRIIILFGAAALLAGLLSWFVYRTAIAPHPETRTTVLAAVRNMQVGEAFRKGDLKKVNVLPRDFPKGALTAEKDALNRVALYPISANAPLVNDGLSRLTGADGFPATIEPGYRAVSVTINDVSGVAGLIAPGAHVDVLFTRPGTMAEAITSTILQDVKVLAIGHSVQPNQVVDLKAPKVPVATLLVNPEDAQKLELAKNEGRISLSLRNPLDKSAGVDGHPVNADVLDPSLKAKVAMTRLRNSTDPRAWDALTQPKPAPVAAPVKPASPPPPRAVVDVFRGDKHVQDVFHD
jgi:pilus assembly protein CpaB